MKFHQGLAGLLILLFPFASTAEPLDDRNFTQTPLGRDFSAPEDWESGKIIGTDGGQRALEQIQSLPRTGRQLDATMMFDFERICTGKPITRTVPCGGMDAIMLELKQSPLKLYTIDVQRVDCQKLDPSSKLFGPDPDRILVSEVDDFGFSNLPDFCTSRNFYSDPLIQFEPEVDGYFTLETTSKQNTKTPPCTGPGLPLLKYRVFVSCSDCGNGRRDDTILDSPPTAECDDGNNFNKDLCSATCRLPFCGDGRVTFPEECDEASDVATNGCSALCKRTEGHGGTEGDPHFKTWQGHRFDYHGECDLLLIHTAEFESGVSLDVHIRTKIRHDMSYISSAALRIGKDLLEVESQGVYWLNGVLNADLPVKFSGFALSHTQPTGKQHVFDVNLGDRESIKIKTYKDFVSVSVEQGQDEHFGKSVGLMGDFGMGHMLARDGKTIMDNAIAYGQEWQVRDTEPSLFQNLRFPQHPDACTMPTPVQAKASQRRRRLSESSSDAQVAAEKACAHWGEGKDDCVFDVLTTGDLEMAMVGAY
jgi:cysteine-rich repeat protein